MIKIITEKDIRNITKNQRDDMVSNGIYINIPIKWIETTDHYNAYLNLVAMGNGTDNGNQTFILQSVTKSQYDNTANLSGYIKEYDRKTIYFEGQAKGFQFDITELIKERGGEEVYLRVVCKLDIPILFNLIEKNWLMMHVIDTKGLNPLCEYQSQVIGNLGIGQINLSTGNIALLQEGYTLEDKEVPLNIKTVYNDFNCNEDSILPYGIKANFEYRIYKEHKFVIVEDYTLNKSYYLLKSKSEIEEECKVTLDVEGDIYYNVIESKYLVYTTNTLTNLKLYDLKGNYQEFEIVNFNSSKDCKTYLKKMFLGESKTITYGWDQYNKLKTIQKNNETVIKLDYENNYLKKVDFIKDKKTIEYVYDMNLNKSIKITLNDYKNEIKFLSAISCNFDCTNKLEKVIDQKSQTGIKYQRIDNNEKYTLVEEVIKNTILTGNYQKIFYGFEKAKIVNNYLEELNYYFDNNLRCIQQIDQNKNSQSKTFEQYTYEKTPQKIHSSRIHSNKRNYLQNNNINKDIMFINKNYGWQKEGVNSKYQLFTDGVYSDKCLYISKPNEERVRIYQQINYLPSGKYKFKGFLKYSAEAAVSQGEIVLQIYTIGRFEETKKTYYFTGKSDWQELEVTEYNVLSDEEVMIEIKLQGQALNLYLSDLTWSKDEVENAYNYVENGYFENTQEIAGRQLPLDFYWSSNLNHNEDKLKPLVKKGTNLSNEVIQIDKELLEIVGKNGLHLSGEAGETKKIYQEVLLNGDKYDEIVISAIVKANINEFDLFEIKATLKNIDTPQVTYVFDLQKHTDNWQILNKGIIANAPFHNILLEICYNGNSAVDIAKLEVIKGDVGLTINCDKFGNVVSFGNEDNSFKNKYDEDSKLLIESYDEFGQKTEYKYNAAKKLEKIISVRTTTILTYDEDGNQNGSKVESNSSQYLNYYNAIDQNQILMDNAYFTMLREKASFKNKSKYDELGRIIEQTDYLGNTLYSSYEDDNIYEQYPQGLRKNYLYKNDSSGEILQIVEALKDKEYKSSQKYSQTGNIEEISLVGGSKYVFKYNEQDYLEEILIDDVILSKYYYNNEGLLLEKHSSMNDMKPVVYTYNQKRQVESISLGNSKKVSFKYNSLGKTIYIKDEETKVEKYISYDNQGNINKINDTLGGKKTYNYNKQENTNQIVYDIADKVVNKEILTDVVSSVANQKQARFDEYISKTSIANKDDLVSCKPGYIGNNGATPYNRSNIEEKIDKQGLKILVLNDLSSSIAYDKETINKNRYSSSQYEEWTNKLKQNKLMYLWIKVANYPTNSESFLHLFGHGSRSDEESNYDGGIELKIASNGKIELIDLICCQGSSFTSNTLIRNEWNFIALELNKQTSGKYNLRLMLNERSLIINDRVPFNREKFDGIAKYIVGYNDDFMSEQGPREVKIELACLGMGCDEHSTQAYLDIYRQGKDILDGQEDSIYYGTTIHNSIEEARFELNQTATYHHEATTSSALGYTTSRFNSTKGKESIDLNGSFISSKGRTYYELRDYEQDLFMNDNDCQVYYASGLLSYKFELKNEGTQIVKFKIPDIRPDNKTRYILASVRNRSCQFGIAVIKDKLYYIKEGCSTAIYISGVAVTIEPDRWYYVGYSWYTQDNTQQITVLFEGDEIEAGTKNIMDSKTCLGSNNEEEDEYTIYECLEGKLQNFIYLDKKISAQQCFELMFVEKALTVRHEYDEFDRVNNQKIVYRGKTLQTNYKYQQVESNLTNNIEEEQRVYSDSKTRYRYDKQQNIVSIIEFKGQQVVKKIGYKYDEMSRLILETNELSNEKIEYVYNNTNNREYKNIYELDTNRLKSKDKYEYDGIIKDHLLKVTKMDETGNVLVTQDYLYSQVNQTLPSKIGSNNLLWEGRRLTSYNDNKYKYNSEGIRVRKERVNDITDIYVDGSRVIGQRREKDNQVITSSFNYDVNGLLVSINLNNEEYFYIRDITGNINSIIDINNKTMVEYRYDGFGNPSIIDIDKTTKSQLLINNNPFIYKGYYYDTETKLYYLNSRYYDPEISRFISADDISYLEPSSINGLNLYAYCGNNPVMYFDRTGHFPILITLGIILGASIGFGAVAYSDYQDDGLIFNGSISWQTYLGGTLIGGALGGFVAYAIPAITSFMGSSFTFGGGMVMTASGQMMMAVGITITGAQVLGAVGALGALYMFASSNRPNSNVVQNKQFNDAARAAGLNPNDPKVRDLLRQIHEYIRNNKLNLGFKELIELIKSFI